MHACSDIMLQLRDFVAFFFMCLVEASYINITRTGNRPTYVSLSSLHELFMKKGLLISNAANH